MKKLISLITAAMLTLSLSITAMAEDTAKSIGTYSSVSIRSYYDCAKLTYLSKNFKMKSKKLEVREDEFLLIPKGVKLYLEKGAEISGSIYVAKGGYLFIKGGDVEIFEGGSIYADGYVSFAAKSTLKLERNSELFVNKIGTLKLASDNSLNADSLGDIICIGKTSSTLDSINKKAVAAYVSDEKGTEISEDPESLLPTARNYKVSMGKVDSGTKQRVTFIFDKGACLRADKRNGEFKFFGNTCVGIAGSYLYNDNFYNDINEIVTINGADYIADVNTGGTTLRMTDDLKPIDLKDSDNSLMTEALNNISKYEYLGKSKTPLPVYFNKAGADLYLMDNGYILAITPCENAETLPDYMNATADELAQLRDVALYEPV